VPASLTVVGIGADGWPGLAEPGRNALLAARVVLGGGRQLELLPTLVTGTRVPWPSPLLPALPGLLAEYRDEPTVILASGDPMAYGIGATLARLLGPGEFDVLPHPSSVSLACARLGWPSEDVAVLSAVGRPLAALHPLIQPGRRVLVLVATTDGAAAVAELLRGRGFGPSRLTVLEQLGGGSERVTSGTAADWSVPAHDPLAIVAIDCIAGPDADVLSTVPGRPESAFDTDGQITKREVRAVTLALLAPTPGQLLWDVGAGSGSVAIEWLRTHPSCRAVAIEPRADRLARIAHNAELLGVPSLQVVPGSAPAALADLPRPDAIFIGGGLTSPGVLDACLAALPAGGRLVANAVTLEAERVVLDQHARLGGELIRVSVERVEPIGGFTGWRPARPVTQWAYTKREGS
jgi:precorrin-6Y C5,15-methyltransferase (decarboxylating)